MSNNTPIRAVGQALNALVTAGRASQAYLLFIEENDTRLAIELPRGTQLRRQVLKTYRRTATQAIPRVEVVYHYEDGHKILDDIKLLG